MELNDIKNGMEKSGYICSVETATTLYLARQLNKPILVEGPAGVGKTSLAQAYAEMNSAKLIRLQCYEGIDEARALYEWNYKKQLLHIQAAAGREKDPVQLEKEIFSEEYLLTRPLLAAIQSPEQVCLLIDEIDKVDFEFEAMLLELLSEFQITIPELGTIKARTIPYIFLTSNATRELSEALKRRCLYIYLDYPSRDMEQLILETRLPNLNKALAAQVVHVVESLRNLNLRKPPSIAESIDWAASLLALNADTLTRETYEATMAALIKHREDMERSLNKFDISS